MKRRDRQPFLDFAHRYADSNFYPTFNAASAIDRAAVLMQDIESFRVLAATDKKMRPWYEFEILSYHAVGFVTCLEWHARSRLVDLFNFAPKCIQAKDFERINDNMLSHISAQNVNIATLLGGMLLVTSAEAYTEVFNRVFSGLSIEVDARAILSRQRAPFPGGAEFSLLSELEDLFDYRHQLVHEIGTAHAGPQSLREDLGFVGAAGRGANVLLTMETIEALITQRAPDGFPNKIDAQGVPISDVTRLMGEIRSIEDAITADLASEDAVTQKDWSNALDTSRACIESTLAFLKGADFLHQMRHVDLSRPMVLSLLRGRLAFLRQLVPSDKGDDDK